MGLMEMMWTGLLPVIEATAAAITATISGGMSAARGGFPRGAGGGGMGLGWCSARVLIIEIRNKAISDRITPSIATRKGRFSVPLAAVSAMMEADACMDDQSGMLPCFFGGRVSCLPMMPRKARARVLRETAGSITSVIMPLEAA